MLPSFPSPLIPLGELQPHRPTTWPWLNLSISWDNNWIEPADDDAKGEGDCGDRLTSIPFLRWLLLLPNGISIQLTPAKEEGTMGRRNPLRMHPTLAPRQHILAFPFFFPLSLLVERIFLAEERQKRRKGRGATAAYECKGNAKVGITPEIRDPRGSTKRQSIVILWQRI